MVPVPSPWATCTAVSTTTRCEMLEVADAPRSCWTCCRTLSAAVPVQVISSTTAATKCLRPRCQLHHSQSGTDRSLVCKHGYPCCSTRPPNLLPMQRMSSLHAKPDDWKIVSIKSSVCPSSALCEGIPGETGSSMRHWSGDVRAEFTARCTADSAWAPACLRLLINVSSSRCWLRLDATLPLQTIGHSLHAGIRS